MLLHLKRTKVYILYGLKILYLNYIETQFCVKFIARFNLKNLMVWCNKIIKRVWVNVGSIVISVWIVSLHCGESCINPATPLHSKHNAMRQRQYWIWVGLHKDNENRSRNTPEQNTYVCNYVLNYNGLLLSSNKISNEKSVCYNNYYSSWIKA